MKKMYMIILLITAILSVSVTTWAGVLDNDVIQVGTESTYPPYEFRDENNNLKGFDIEMMEAIAEKIGKKVEWVDMPFDSLIALGSMAACREKGLVRSEGKDYVMQDGDVTLFRFNV